MVWNNLGVEVEARVLIYVSSESSVSSYHQCCVEPPARSTARSTSAPSVSESLFAFHFLIQFLMISATKQKRLIRIPTNHIPRGRWKCSIRRGSGLLSSGSSLKWTSMAVNPAWNVKIKFNELKRTQCDLLEPQHVIVELLLHRPFLVQQVGTEWAFATFPFTASVPFPPL